jgi:phenylacetate-CoA ligase
VNGLAFGFTVAGMSFGDLLSNLGGLVANTGSRSTLATPARIARAIARLRPAVIAATPGDFLAWMRIVREDHPDDYERVVGELKLLMSTAELCADSRVKRIEEEFGILHVDVYACVEGFFALPCPCGEKHVLPAYHAEVFDPAGAPLGTEGTGRFAFTNLLKRSTPMVRYMLDDWVTLRASECPYGFATSVVPHGRFELTVPIEGGRIGSRHVEEELFSHALFGDYRVHLTQERCKVTVETYSGDPDAETVKAGLAKLFGADVELDFVPYGELTDYRAVRISKPILRLRDERPVSEQNVPAHL